MNEPQTNTQSESQSQSQQPNINEKLLKPYDPQATEDRIFQTWLDSGFFNPDNLPDHAEGSRTEPFTIVLPPPNVTGVLHLGHAYEDALQDSIIRYQRMKGKKTLWIPGTDSAAIATQARVEKNIQKDEGKSRHDLGREELVRRVEEYAKASENTIVSQVKKMGTSLDWSRYAYTLDEKRYTAVKTAFVNMYNAGLIYQGDRIVNWDPKGQTTISDDEIEYKEEKAKFYHFKYGPFEIGTARPETKFGDKYVVMHPEDKRYAQYEHGQKIELEWINGPITATIIKDTAIDMEFGTGVMTITPWHSAVDFEIAERHGLDKEQIIDKYGKLLKNDLIGEFGGMKIAEAREKIVQKLRAKGLVTKEEDYTHNIATAERTGATIEPQIMKQWWVAVDKQFTIPHSEIPDIASGSTTTLKDIMRASVASGAVDMPQENFRKTYFNWINNLHDWCISRQIWFGHRIPVWYKEQPGSAEKEIYCGVNPPDEATMGTGWIQEDDVLDTWFSSALWTFSTLGWPEKTSDLTTFHPTAVLLPGYEILQLWVSRMIMMSGFHLGQVPYHKVLIHGIVRDKQGRKFSKSLGNGVDPLEVIAKYGADALRMGLMVGTAIGNDSQYDESKIKGYKNFANKLWNITRFVMTSVGDDIQDPVPYTDIDQAHLNNFQTIFKDITKDMDEYRLYMAAEKIYHYIWHEFADVLIEESKPILNGTDETAKKSRQQLLLSLLKWSVTSLHPFMPFVTEEIWSMLPGVTNLLIVEPWPIKS